MNQLRRIWGMNALGHDGPLKQMRGCSLKLHLGQQIILVLEYWVPFTAEDFVPSTWMHADAYPHRNTRQVSELEGTHEGQDVQRHAADIHRVSVSISLGKPRGHHVGITDRLHLRVDGWHDDVCGLCYLSLYLLNVTHDNTLYTSWWSTMLSKPL